MGFFKILMSWHESSLFSLQNNYKNKICGLDQHESHLDFLLIKKNAKQYFLKS